MLWNYLYSNIPNGYTLKGIKVILFFLHDINMCNEIHDCIEYRIDLKDMHINGIYLTKVSDMIFRLLVYVSNIVNNHN